MTALWVVIGVSCIMAGVWLRQRALVIDGRRTRVVKKTKIQGDDE
jgi:hypothetical protein